MRTDSCDGGPMNIIRMNLGIYGCSLGEEHEEPIYWEAEIPPLWTGLDLAPTCPECESAGYFMEAVER